jgi:ketosteroid isomerase-like protein
MTNVEIVKGAYDAFGCGDLEALLGAFDEQIEWRPAESHPYAGNGERWVGADAITANLIVRTGEEWDGFVAKPRKFHDAGETVVVQGRYGGTFKPSGRELDAEFCHVWTVREGKIAIFDQYVDTAQLHAVMT